MEIDNKVKVEQFLKMEMFTKVLKQAVGDSNSFQIMLESLLNSMADNKNLKDIGYGKGQKIDSIINNVKKEIKCGVHDIETAIEKAAKKFNIDKDFIKAVIKQESSFNPKAVSSAGAQGLMQLMPGTSKELGVKNPFNIQENINGGTKYLRGLLDMYGNSKELALAAYNGGTGTLNSKGVKSKEDISKLCYETKNYVKKVMNYYKK